MTTAIVQNNSFDSENQVKHLESRQQWLPWKKHESATKIADVLNNFPANWNLTPVIEKRPILNNWQSSDLSRESLRIFFTEGEQRTSKEGKPYTAFGTGVGLKTGNGFLVCDVDGNSEDCEAINFFNPIIEPYISCSPVWTSGKPGRYGILFAIPEDELRLFEGFAHATINHFEDGSKIEIRYERHQCLLPPSYHPETGVYKWVNECYTPINLPFEVFCEFEIEVLRLHDSSQNQAAKEEKDLIPTNFYSEISFYLLASNKVQEIFAGNTNIKDESRAITTAIKEYYGWKNSLYNHQILLKESVDDICTKLEKIFDLENGRIERILKTIKDPGSCLPRIVLASGDVGFWKKIKDTDENVFELKCSTNIKDELNTGNLKKNIVEEIRNLKGAQYEVNGKDITQSSAELVILNSLFEKGEGNWKCWNSGFYHYSGKGFWEFVLDKEVATDITRTLPKLYQIIEPLKAPPFPMHTFAHNRTSEDVFKYSRKYLNVKNFDSNCNHVVFNNCTLDLTNGEQVKHSREHLTTQYIDADYEPNQECPEIFKKFIADSYGEEYLDIIRAFTASFLDSSVHYPFFPYIIGKSGSGKGVLARFWSSLFPETSVRAGNSFELISSPDKRHQNLTGVRLYSFPDMSGYHRKLGDFYELVDNGRLSGRALFDSAGYEKKWNVHFVICSVYPLQVENASEGWDRRAIPLSTKERTSKNDPHLEQKLKEVIPQVISWALAMPKEERYLTLLEARNNPKVAEKRREIDILSDNVKSFIDRCLVPDNNENATLQTTKLYHAYQAFCKAHGLNAVGNPVFISRLKLALSKYFVDRKSVKRDGKVQKISAYWKHLKFVPQLIDEHNPSFASNNEVFLNSEFCQDGGLEELENFWKQPKEEDYTSTALEVQILINDMVQLPIGEDVYGKVIAINVNEKGKESYECILKDGTSYIEKEPDSCVLLNEECLEELKINPKTFGLPKQGSWVELETDKRAKEKAFKSIAYVSSVLEHGFCYQENKKQAPKIHRLGWRELELQEYSEHGKVFGQV